MGGMAFLSYSKSETPYNLWETKKKDIYIFLLLKSFNVIQSINQYNFFFFCLITSALFIF